MSMSIALVSGPALCDGEIKETSSGKRVGKFRVKHVYMGSSGVTENIYSVTKWCGRPEFEEEVLKVKKGQITQVSGELRAREYVNKEGVTKFGLEIMALAIDTVPMAAAGQPVEEGGYDPFAD